MALIEHGLIDLIELGHLFARTRDWLFLYLAGHEDLEGDGSAYLATTALSHIEDVQEGLRWALRATDAEQAELRYLVRAADVIDCSDSPDTRPDRRVVEPEVRRLAALANARLVFGVLPRVPPERVSYPTFAARSYADIPVPRGPAELLDRVEELERSVWQTAAHAPIDRLDQGAYRRTYGFFEAGSWLVTQHLSLFNRHA